MATEYLTDALPGTVDGGHPHPEPTMEPAVASKLPDLFTLLGDLSDAIALVTVVHRSLEAQQIAAVDNEEVALRYALTLLRAAYNALDVASCRIS